MNWNQMQDLMNWASQSVPSIWPQVFVPAGSGLNPEKGGCVPDLVVARTAGAPSGYWYRCPPDWEARAVAMDAVEEAVVETAETAPTAPVLVSTAPGLSSGTKLALGAAAGVALGLLFFRRSPRSNPSAPRYRAGSTVAETILQQLGGAGRLRAMIGAKYFIDHGGALSFKFPNRQRSRGNYVKITLTPEDYYDMEFGQLMKHAVKPVKAYRGIMWDQLIEVFEQQTGLYLRL